MTSTYTHARVHTPIQIYRRVCPARRVFAYVYRPRRVGYVCSVHVSTFPETRYTDPGDSYLWYWVIPWQIDRWRCAVELRRESSTLERGRSFRGTCTAWWITIVRRDPTDTRLGCVWVGKFDVALILLYTKWWVYKEIVFATNIWHSHVWVANSIWNLRLYFLFWTNYIHFNFKLKT